MPRQTSAVIGAISFVLMLMGAISLESRTYAQDRKRGEEPPPKFRLRSEPSTSLPKRSNSEPEPSADFGPALDQPRPSRTRSQPAETEPLENLEPTEVDRRQLGRRRRSDAVPASTPATLDRGESINPQLLEAVRDDTIGLQVADRPAYFHTLWLCQQLDQSVIAHHADRFRTDRMLQSEKYVDQRPEDFPVYVDLFQHPPEYRGRPVTLRGHFRKLVQYDPGTNDLGIQRVHEGWLYTDDSQSHPTVVIFTGKPSGLNMGGDITEEVQVSGYFLKMYGYDARDTTRRAPLILAGDIEWFPSSPATLFPAIPLWLYALTGLLVLLGVWGLIQLRAEDDFYRRARLTGRDFATFPPLEFLDPSVEHASLRTDTQH